jgi:hypothetical protein
MRTMAAPSSVGLIADVLRCQYELTHLDSGAAVYYFTGFPQHYVCPYCFEQALLHVLQYRRVGAGYFACPGCQTSFPVQPSTGRVSVV